MTKTYRTIIVGIFTTITFIGATDFDPNNFKNREVIAIRLTSPLTIDGNLDESLYKTQTYTDFVQYVPLNGHPATEKTDVWIGYDESAIYVGARMWDSEPNLIVSRIGRRDENDNSDLFEVIFDSYHDKRTGFSFQINPAGAINDETYYNDGFTERSWDGIWEGKTKIDDKGWTAELRIPYSQLRFDKKEEYTWGVIPTRYIQRKDEWNYFMYVSLEESGTIRHAAELTGLSNISPSKRVEVRPYITTGASLLPGKKDNPFYNGKDATVGLGADFKLGIGSNITIDGTINPDFGQVEADPSEINLSAYETYYDEKRPFFIEGQNIFLFGRGGPTNNFNIDFSEPRLFYSRRIGREPQGWVLSHPDSVKTPGVTNILGAAKVSGKLKGNWSIGGLTALTNHEHTQYYDGGIEKKELLEPATYYNVIRAQKEFNEGKQGIGFMGTSVTRFLDGLSILGSEDEEHNLYNKLSENAATFGIDGWTFLGSNNDWGIGAWFGATQVSGSKDRILSLQKSSNHYYQRPDADHVEIDENLTKLSGYAGRIKINKETGNLIVNAALGIISPGFESNDLGYQGRTDVINKHLGLGYNWTKPTKYYRSMYSLLAYANNHDFSGIKSGESIIWMNQIRFNNFWQVHGNIFWGLETLSNTALRGGPRVIEPASWEINQLGFNSDNRKNITIGSHIDYSYGINGNRDRNFDITIASKFNNRFTASISPMIKHHINTDQYITSINDVNNTAMFGKRYVVGKLDQTTFIASIRANFTFSPNLTLQTYLQPFISVGSYSGFKEYLKPESYEFLKYGEENSTISNIDGNGYVIDPTGGDPEDAFTIYNPDFNYKAFIGTLVLRWEFSPGSSVFFVWTHNGTNFENPGDFSLGRDMGNLLSAKADDIFAIKLSYWIGK